MLIHVHSSILINCKRSVTNYISKINKDIDTIPFFNYAKNFLEDDCQNVNLLYLKFQYIQVTYWNF